MRYKVEIEISRQTNRRIDGKTLRHTDTLFSSLLIFLFKSSLLISPFCFMLIFYPFNYLFLSFLLSAFLYFNFTLIYFT